MLIITLRNLELASLDESNLSVLPLKDMRTTPTGRSVIQPAGDAKEHIKRKLEQQQANPRALHTACAASGKIGGGFSLLTI